MTGPEASLASKQIHDFPDFPNVVVTPAAIAGVTRRVW